jgi:hypothetical protein
VPENQIFLVEEECPLQTSPSVCTWWAPPHGKILEPKSQEIIMSAGQ